LVLHIYIYIYIYIYDISSLRVNVQQFHVLSAERTYVFCMVLRTLTFSLYSINSLVFIIEMECVYCAVRPVSLSKSSFLLW